MIIYIKITSKPDKNTIIRVENSRKWYRYIFGADKWIRTGLLAEYWGDDFEDHYEKVSEEEAMVILEKQKIHYKKMYEEILERAKIHVMKERELFIYINEKGGFQDIEKDIVALIYCFGEEFYKNLDSNEFPYRILKSVKVLFENTDLENEKHIMALRKDLNTHDIAKFIIEKRYCSGMMSKNQYDILKDYFDLKILYLSEKDKKV